MRKWIKKWIKKWIAKLVLLPIDKYVKPLIAKLAPALLRLLNNWKFKNPRQQIDNRTVLIYCPNIGGHRPIYSAKIH